MKKHMVRLEAGERIALEQAVRIGKPEALSIRHADILLAVDESETALKLSDAHAAQAFDVAVRSIESLRRRLVSRDWNRRWRESGRFYPVSSGCSTVRKWRG